MKTFLIGWSFASALFLMACNANAPRPATANPAVPDKIKVQPNEVLKFAAHTKNGVQIYECDTIAPGKYGWVFKAPEADLYDESEKKIGTHYKSTGATWAGPAWEFADGSRVIGKKIAEENPPAGTDAIPWLLLEGSNHFVGITKIQRVNTVGGKAPEGECDAASVGKQVRVDYSATYYFYTAK